MNNSLKTRKMLINKTAEKLGCIVEQIDLRSGWARIRKNGQMILVHFWRGMTAEQVVCQVRDYVKAA